MKTLFFLIFLIPMLPQQERITEISPATETLKLKIKGKLDLGRKSRNCRGLGICRVQIDASVEEPISNTTIDVTLTIENDIVTEIEFETGALDPGTYKEYFADAIFTIGETFKDRLTKKAFLLLVKKGKYKLKKTKKGFLLEVSG